MASHHAHCRSVCKYVVRCIIHSRYPIGTKFDTCGITADTQVSDPVPVLNLIPGTCEVSSIMAGCEVWLAARNQAPHAFSPFIPSPRLHPCFLLLLQPMSLLASPSVGSRRGGSNTKEELGGRGHCLLLRLAVSVLHRQGIACGGARDRGGSVQRPDFRSGLKIIK
uniref:Uncharacterized protein n=1 Tax=Oryza barthii TaxID=65489 RepID=A0A0D3F510_9ORYZ